MSESAMAQALHRVAITMPAVPAPDAVRRIVLVDDEEVLAWSLSNRLARARPSWIVDTANDGESALTRIKTGPPIDLLVADVRMPGMSGIDLILAARQQYPSLPVVIMTAFRTPDVQRIVNGPFTGFLEKPFEFDRLLDLVDEALKDKLPAAAAAVAPASKAGGPPRHNSKGFSGAISVQTLPDIVQLYILSSTTGVLSVGHQLNEDSTRREEGKIWFERGTIVHAFCPDPALVGDEAFYEIMTWTGGEFRMRSGHRTMDRSIRSDWQELVMESCRRIDELHRNEPRDDGSEGTGTGTKPPRGWTQSPPAPDSAPELTSSEVDVDAAFDEFLRHERITKRPSAPPPAASASSTSSQQASQQQEQPTESLEVKMNIKDSLAKLNSIDGFVGAALVDSESGMLLGQEGGGVLNLEVAAAGNTEVVRAKRKTMSSLALKDQIEDILITLGKQYHLIRPLRARSAIFFYVALDRQRANLAMARLALADVEKELSI